MKFQSVWILWAVLSVFTAGCGGKFTESLAESPSASQWTQLAPGIRYVETEGQVSLEMSPPLFTAYSLQEFERFAQERIKRAASDQERAYWEEQVAWVKDQFTIWQDEERVASVLEKVVLERYPFSLKEADLGNLKAKLREIVGLLRQAPQSEGSKEILLPTDLKSPDGGLAVSPDNFSLLVQSLTPQSLFPSCSLAASAMPTTEFPGAKAYATASCSTNAVVWGRVETRTTARAGNNWPAPCQDSGWPASQCMSVAYGSTSCFSTAWSGYYYQWADLRVYSNSRSASNSRCR